MILIDYLPDSPEIVPARASARRNGPERADEVIGNLIRISPDRVRPGSLDDFRNELELGGLP